MDQRHGSSQAQKRKRIPSLNRISFVTFGPVRKSCGRRKNKEISDFYVDIDTMRYIKLGRLCWAGHVDRRRNSKKNCWMEGSTRPRGRDRSWARWKRMLLSWMLEASWRPAYGNPPLKMKWTSSFRVCSAMEIVDDFIYDTFFLLIH